jgi:hypothetical protein
MLNNRVLAAAEGMPEVNRRRLLLGLASASAVAATVSIPEADAAPSENPELVRLGNLLPAAEAEHEAAVEYRWAIDREWSPRWPQSPKALHRSGGSRDEVDRDLAGWGYKTVKYGEEQIVYLHTAKSLQFGIDFARDVLKRKTVDRRNVAGRTRAEWEAELADKLRLQKMAARLEAKRARVLKASGYKEAKNDVRAKRDAMLALIQSIMIEQETSMAGVVIKAQALAAHGRLTSVYGTFVGVDMDSLEWGSKLSASVLRIAEGGVS